MYLCTNPEILSIFGHDDAKEAEHVVYICFLSMARAGLLSLEFYDPVAKKWGQGKII